MKRNCKVHKMENLQQTGLYNDIATHTNKFRDKRCFCKGHGHIKKPPGTWWAKFHLVSGIKKGYICF